MADQSFAVMMAWCWVREMALRWASLRASATDQSNDDAALGSRDSTSWASLRTSMRRTKAHL